jgi:hypothetical protein
MFNISDDVGVNWIVGTPGKEGQNLWLVTDAGDQYRLGTSSSRSTNSSNITNTRLSPSTAAYTTVLPWNVADEPNRPLVISDSSDWKTSMDDSFMYQPFPQPLITSWLSSAVPTPNGGVLLVAQSIDSDGSVNYSIIQLASNWVDDNTHES